jgi:hypothetical protein
MLVRCLYASRAAKPLSEQALCDILKQSRKNNPALGVTGLLCYTSDVFVQVLEGGRDEINHLLNRIVRDDRNSDVQILSFEEILERSFNNWAMGEVDLAHVNSALVLKYCAKAEFDPFSASSGAMLSLLRDLATAGAIGSRVK